MKKSPSKRMDTMEPDPKIMRALMLETVDNQIRQNQPPETRQTLKRLIELGYTEMDAKLLIAQCVSVLIFNTMKYKMPADMAKYVVNLKNLPASPLED